MTESLVPSYNENIIVGVVYNKKFDWYLTENEIWFLDYKTRIEAFEQIGYKINLENIADERKGLLVLDSSNASIFLERIEQYRVETEWLRELLIEKINMKDEDYVYDFCPSLYVNFDDRNFISYYPEPAFYEKYMPPHWKGIYIDFLNLVPENKRYWMGKNGNNMFEREENL